MPQSLYHPDRVMQLILRDPITQHDLIVLDICGPEMGAQGISLLSGFSGLMHAPRTVTRESAAHQEGSKPGDFPRVDERIIDVRLSTKGNTPALWETIDNLLWRVLTFDEDAYLRWYSAKGYWREMKVRLERKPVDTMTYDPRVTQHMVWSVTLLASDPWWYGVTHSSTWRNTNATGSGTLRLFNPTPRPLWVQFAGNKILSGSGERWTLPDAGVKYPTGHAKAGQFVTHTLPLLTPGKEFYVDTHPLRETLMVKDNSLEWAKMKAEEFLFAIPPHTRPFEVPVSVVGGSTQSSVTAFMETRYDRPWGGEAPWYVVPTHPMHTDGMFEYGNNDPVVMPA